MEELLATARDELRKLNMLSTPQQPDLKDQSNSASDIIENSIAYADNVLKRLIAHTMGEDVKTLFEDCIDTRGSILIDDGKKKYTMQLDIVPRDYMLDLLHFSGRSDVKERMAFLLNTVKVLFCPLRDHIRKDHSFQYVLAIDKNTTLFFDKDSANRIGITLTEISH